jgi:hypothetical protein
MNAPVVDVAALRAERRRQATFTGMKSTLLSLKLDIDRISVLGNDEAAHALARFRKSLELVGCQAASLQGEFIELVEIEHEQNTPLRESPL